VERHARLRDPCVRQGRWPEAIAKTSMTCADVLREGHSGKKVYFGRILRTPRGAAP